MKSSKVPALPGLLVVLFSSSLPSVAQAYVGPGAGFAFVSSFFIMFATFLVVGAVLATWPLRWVFLALRSRKARRRSRVRKVVVLGLDGLDPDLTEKWMNEGALPNFARLRDQGSFRRLRTTFPAVSPVAWSSFQTGCNPGRHRIFDFLEPNRRSHLPELSSARIGPPRRVLRLGRWRIPLSKPDIELRRKSRPFWCILGDHGVFSSVIRVPITFPPEKFRGVSLSGMCVPDLKGTQGTFAYYSDDPADEARLTGGTHVAVRLENGVARTHVAGPENALREGAGEIRIPLTLRVGKNGSGVQAMVGGARYALPLREYTPWIPLEFRPGLGTRVRGTCRFYLKETEPHLRLYMSPIQIDPERPALPISHPYAYSVYLAKTQGPFATLGLAEDTWALNERVLDEDAFLQQVYSIHQERERMFFDAIDKTRRGLTACVFDATDRIQHMFWRTLEADHPSNRDKEAEEYRDTIPDLYRRMDDLVGRTMAKIEDDSVLIVMSDHGFKSFQRGVNLNSWLLKNGYLAVKGDSASGKEWFEEVDWSRTRASAVGLGGIYLNMAGRERDGIVQRGEEAETLKREIGEKLRALVDEERRTPAVRDVYDSREVYKGPYVDEAPDLLVGFALGYRASWGCATGLVDDRVFEDNEKSWSGDHCVNPEDVPGVFFASRPIASDAPHIMDIAPTVLDLFGLDVPAYCDGAPLMPADERAAAET
ncbi:alkaline phosphatase family protein [Candidatus Sumerlaeota bacterium]|nr:alkaline phosphatase family protein [Candidatus Sumerlaeota bacterium]